MTKDGLFSAIVVGAIVAALLATLLHQPKASYLVGYGCEGSGGKTLVGKEEDDFPPCSKIERVSQ